MTTPPPGEGTHELADMPQLSDVQATDALLDRLAARTPTGDDLADPIVADLVELARFADEAPTPDLAVARLIEVLDGRPLYMFPRGSQPATEADQPIQLDAGRSASRVIDVSDRGVFGLPGAAAAALDTEQDDAADVTPVAARVAVPAVSSLAVVRAVRAANARRLTGSGAHGWQGTVQQLALPAASVVIIALLGGGVSAVVTGDPMSPINGVTNIASSLPGLNGGQKKIDRVTADILSAKRAAAFNNPGQADHYLSSASQKLEAVPEDSKPELRKQIAAVKDKLPAVPAKPSGSKSAPATSATASPSVTPSATPSQPVSPPPSVTPSATPSASATTSPAASATSDAAATSGSDADAAKP